MEPIIHIRRKEPFDGDGWLFELKLEGFRGLADSIQGRLPLFPLPASLSDRGQTLCVLPCSRSRRKASVAPPRMRGR
jgi:hypothetical protein